MGTTDIINTEAIKWLRYVLNPDIEMPSVSDWKAVIEFAGKQALVGICFHEACAYTLSEDDYFEWLGLLLQIEEKNKNLNNRIETLFSMLFEDGFRCCLLKGQGNAELYPEPLRRCPGDIDIWIDTDEKTAYQYVRSKFPYEKESYKHIHFPIFENAPVDIHYTPLKLYHPIYNKRFQRWIQDQKEEQMSHHIRLIGSEFDITVPTAAFNAVYQLGHIMIHIEDDGIGLRQLVDYFYVLRNLGSEKSETKENIKNTCKRLGMLKLAGAVMWIEKNMLGLNDDYLLVPPDEKKGLLLAEDILEGGNFGHSSGRQRFRRNGKVFKKIADLLHLVKLSSLFPGDAFFRICVKMKTFITKYRLFSHLLILSFITMSSCNCGLVKKTNTQAEGIAFDIRAVADSNCNNNIELYQVASPKKIHNTRDLSKGKKRIVLRNSPILIQNDLSTAKTVYVIKQDFDLQGATIAVPEDCVLVFEGGSIKNGTIVGNRTSIIYDGTIFNSIRIQGTWDVPVIHCSMFGDSQTRCNSLQNILALTDSEVENTVYVEEGYYTLKVCEVTEHLLKLKSHTTIILDGNISVEGNSFPRYRIFSIKDVDNITIKGHGTIIGDRYEHSYIPDAPEPESKRGFNTTHEYGHGIEISNSNNIEMSGITIKDCIGDGICINGKNISCKDITISYCRRQGISITGGEYISITDCNISHVWDSRKAGFGIDIEPRIGNFASYISISDCNIDSCNGGMNFQCHDFESVKHVRVRDCTLSTFGLDTNKGEGREQYRAVMCFGASDVMISNCSIEDHNPLVYVEDAVDFSIMHSKLLTIGSLYSIVVRKLRGIVTLHKNQIQMYENESRKNGYGVAIANLHNAVLTNNDIVSRNLSYSTDTDCNDLVLTNNNINATWEPGRCISDSRIEGNTFTKKVLLKDVKRSSIVGNKVQSLKVKNNDNSNIDNNTIVIQP